MMNKGALSGAGTEDKEALSAVTEHKTELEILKG